jgi:hypothetical protein
VPEVTAPRWQICRLNGETWDLKDGRTYADPEIAIVQLTFATGKVLTGTVETSPGGSQRWRVRDVPTGDTIAMLCEVLAPVPQTISGGPITPSKNGPGPLRRWRGLTWVGWVNYVVLRWFLFRIAYAVEDDGTISRYWLAFVPTWRW